MTVIPALQAGSYVVHLDLDASDSTASEQAATCQLTFSPAVVSSTGVSVAEVYLPVSSTLPLNSHSSQASASTTDAVTVTAGTSVGLTCLASVYFGYPTIDDVSVTATKTGALHLSP